MGTGSFPGVKSGQGVTLTPHPLVVPWSRKSRAIPLLPLWAVRSVQSLSACTRVHFTFNLFYPRYLDSVPRSATWGGAQWKRNDNPTCTDRITNVEFFQRVKEGKLLSKILKNRRHSRIGHTITITRL